MYAKIENNQVAQWPIINITQLFPNTSFPVPITDNSMPAGYVIVHATPMPAIDNSVNKIVEVTPTRNNGKWFQTWQVVNLTPQEIAQLQEEKARQVGMLRAEAYRNESDPLFFKTQRGEATTEQWLEKVTEIKARYPTTG
jgi:hypothetical protein